MDQNHADHKARVEQLKQLQTAYITVFGKEGERTIFQELVLEDLRRLTKYGDSAIERDGTGRYDGGLTAYKAGLQDVMKRIYLRITWRVNDEHERSGDSESAE